jgi:Ser/Thr protein kinase RdoA (MazF antagonist)
VFGTISTADIDTGALAAHLSSRYGISVDEVQQLDSGVMHVVRADGPDWVARVFPADLPSDAIRADAATLAWLAAHDYPAERAAADEPVSTLGESGVLVTEFVHPVSRELRRATVKEAGGLRELGRVLGTLHALPLDARAPGHEGGAWRHAARGLPTAELDAARAWVRDALASAPDGDRASLTVVLDELDRTDGGEGLPRGFTHPDFVLANVVATAGPEAGPGMVVVDWTGAGRGPRLWSLAFLLWVEGGKDLRRIDLLAAGYRTRLALEPDELDRLPGMVRARHLVFVAWNLAAGRIGAAEAAELVVESRERGAAIAERARMAFTAPDR